MNDLRKFLCKKIDKWYYLKFLSCLKMLEIFFCWYFCTRHMTSSKIVDLNICAQTWHSESGTISTFSNLSLPELFWDTKNLLSTYEDHLVIISQLLCTKCSCSVYSKLVKVHIWWMSKYWLFFPQPVKAASSSDLTVFSHSTRWFLKNFSKKSRSPAQIIRDSAALFSNKKL